MAEFERGDIVVYKHVRHGMVWNNDSLGIVTEFRSESQVFVDWIALKDARQMENTFHGGRTNHFAYNLEKVGHIDLPPEARDDAT